MVRYPSIRQSACCRASPPLVWQRLCLAPPTATTSLMTSGKLLARVDENPLPDLNARKKHFAARFPASIDFKLGEMLQLTRRNRRRRSERRTFVVVRSQDIDKFGEGGGYPGSDRDGHGDRKHRCGPCASWPTRSVESCHRRGPRAHFASREGGGHADRLAGRRHGRAASALLDRARRGDAAGDDSGLRRGARATTATSTSSSRRASACSRQVVIWRITTEESACRRWWCRW